MISPILLIICPVLVIRALFELAADVATADPSFLTRINLFGMDITTVIIEGLTQFVVFFVTFLLGFSLGLSEHQYR